MKRWAWTVAICCLALFAGAVWRQVSMRGVPSGRITVNQAEQRYYQCQPKHWSHLMINSK
jgi:hypothetical protein